MGLNFDGISCFACVRDFDVIRMLTEILAKRKTLDFVQLSRLF